MVVRSAAVAVALAVLAAGCGGPSRRHQVSVYLTQVNAIQAQLAAPLVTVSNANQDFAKPHAKPAEVERKLSSAAARIDVLTRRLSRLSAPADARKLKSMLVELARREADLAREVARLATFLPRFQLALRPLATAGAALKKVLAAKGKPEEKAAALETYSATIGGVLRRLHGLDPPPVSAPLLASQVATLEQVRASTSALAKALREKRSKDIPQLLRRFNLAAVSNQSIAVQRAQIAGIEAYNGRIRGLDKLAIRINREQVRLQKTL
jgi:hypothetical protein